jgi:regulatory protein
VTTKVTAIAEHPRRAGRYVVEIDGVAAGAVSVELVAELRLRVGAELKDDARARLDAGVRATACHDKALDALARRARSRAELGRWLKEKEFTPAEIEPTLDRLTDLGLLDDLAFARGFARTRLGPGRGFGPRRVAAELARRGVARGVVDAVLAELAAESGVTEREAIRAVAEKKLRGMRGVDTEAQRRRLYGFLARRGFGMREIADVVRELMR